MSGFTSLGKKSLGGTNGGGNANGAGPFGTALVSNMTPAAQGAFVYGTSPNSSLWLTGSNGAGGLVAVSEGIMSCSSGTSLSGSTFVQLPRYVKYRPGQGIMGRMTAIFEPGQTDTRQLAGVGNKESGYYFARYGTDFGILHRERSKREIRTFTVSAQGSVTVTVTLGGAAKSFAIVGGSDANQTSYLISQQDYSQLGRGWTAESIDGTVYFISETPGPVGGTFDITVGGVSIVTATSTVQAGVLATDTFISQSQWNIDTMDGNGSSRTTLNPSKGNVYGVGYQYLGFGDAVFSIENPESGLLSEVHRIQSAGARDTVVIRNPQMTARWVAINSGSLASNVTIKGASAAVFTEGLVMRNVGPSFSTIATKADVGATAVPALTLRVNRVFSGQCSYGELNLFNVSVGCDAGSSAGNKILKVFIYKNGVIGGPVNFQPVDSRSLVAYDTAATSFTTGANTVLLKSFIVAANSSVILKMEDENFYVANGETISFVVQRGGSSNVDNALITAGWFEDQ